MAESTRGAQAENAAILEVSALSACAQMNTIRSILLRSYSSLIVMLTLSNGSRFGFSAIGCGIVGAAIADADLIAAAGWYRAVLAASAFWSNIVKWIGGYLIWLDVQMIRSSGGPDLQAPQTYGLNPATHRDHPAIFRKSFLAAVINPKG